METAKIIFSLELVSTESKERHRQLRCKKDEVYSKSHCPENTCEDKYLYGNNGNQCESSENQYGCFCKPGLVRDVRTRECVERNKCRRIQKKFAKTTTTTETITFEIETEASTSSTTISSEEECNSSSTSDQTEPTSSIISTLSESSTPILTSTDESTTNTTELSNLISTTCGSSTTTSTSTQQATTDTTNLTTDSCKTRKYQDFDPWKEIFSFFQSVVESSRDILSILQEKVVKLFSLLLN